MTTAEKIINETLAYNTTTPGIEYAQEAIACFHENDMVAYRHFAKRAADCNSRFEVLHGLISAPKA